MTANNWTIVVRTIGTLRELKCTEKLEVGDGDHTGAYCTSMRYLYQCRSWRHGSVNLEDKDNFVDVIYQGLMEKSGKKVSEALRSFIETHERQAAVAVEKILKHRGNRHVGETEVRPRIVPKRCSPRM